MEIDALISLSPEDQLEWLETRFKKEANDAKEDISSYIAGLAWDKPLGSILVLDQSILEEMLEYPDSTDLGWAIKERLPGTSDERAIAINDGTELTPKELSEAKAIARKRQIDEVYMSESGVFCSGSTFTLNNKETAFIAFTGGPLGQGGIDYSFYRVFLDADAALDHFKSQPDIWLPLL